MQSEVRNKRINYLIRRFRDQEIGMGRYSDIAARLKNERRRDDSQEKTFDGHRVSRVIWETAAAVVFEDDKGHFWRYLHAYGECWKVVASAGNPGQTTGGS
jgi:hypothetical protein